MNYVLHLLVYAALFLMLVLSLSMMMGYGGMISVGQASFYGAGAYAAALVSVKGGVPPAAGILVGTVAGGVWAAVFSPIMRLKGDAFVLGTVGINILFYSIVYNISVFGAYLGIAGVPELTSSNIITSLLILLIAAVAGWGFARLKHTKLGLQIRAVRDSRVAALTLGVRADLVRWVIFVLAGTIAGLAGGLSAYYYQYIDPNAYTADLSVLVLAALTMGGLGNTRGAVLGTALVVLLELTRQIHLPIRDIASLRLLVFGIGLILVAIFRPRGLWGEHDLD